MEQQVASVQIKLEPCPFCGGKGELRSTVKNDGYWIECMSCRTYQGIRSLKSAIEAWNRRER